MKRLLLTSILSGLSLTASAEPLNQVEICNRLQIDMDVYIFEKSGELRDAHRKKRKVRKGSRITQVGEECKMNSSNRMSSSAFEGSLYLKQEWDVDQNGKITVVVKQFKKTGPDGRFKGLVKEKSYVVSEMRPIIWQSETHTKEKLIVRLVPSLGTKRGKGDLSKLPIAGRDIIVSDNTGKVWADGLHFRGRYIGITSTEGTLLLSYYPFKGANDFGSVENNGMELHLNDGRVVFVRSSTAFLPKGIGAKVYGEYIASNKTDSLRDRKINSSSNEQEFLNFIKQ